jgi:hypothetical protein
MQDKKLMLLIGLGILAVVSILYGILSPSRFRHDLSPTSVSQQESPKPISPSLSKGPLKRTSYFSWGRNPFLTGIGETSAAGQFILHGISWDGKNPRAVINGRIVGVGQQIGEMKVVKIEKDRVVLSDGFAKVELRIGGRK